MSRYEQARDYAARWVGGDLGEQQAAQMDAEREALIAAHGVDSVQVMNYDLVADATAQTIAGLEDGAEPYPDSWYE